MISSITLLVLQWIGKLDPQNLSFWKYYVLGMAIEVGIYVLCIKKLNDWDIKTNYGRNRNND